MRDVRVKDPIFRTQDSIFRAEMACMMALTDPNGSIWIPLKGPTESLESTLRTTAAVHDQLLGTIAINDYCPHRPSCQKPSAVVLSAAVLCIQGAEERNQHIALRCLSTQLLLDVIQSVLVRKSGCTWPALLQCDHWRISTFGRPSHSCAP